MFAVVANDLMVLFHFRVRYMTSGDYGSGAGKVNFIYIYYIKEMKCFI